MSADINIDSLKYPTGKFVKGKTYTSAEIKANIEAFSAFPAQLKAFISGWDEKRLNTVYREGGWNGRQVIHHLADSHGNLPLRVKTCLTETDGQIKPYDENKWSGLYDANHSDIRHSFAILEGTHARLSDLFRNLGEADWKRTVFHPESKHLFTLAELLALYAWHGPHHLGHLKIIDQNVSNS